MNLVGKIFVFLIFCMSVVFMSFAVVVYATHTVWRDEVLRPKEKAVAGKELGLKFQLENEKKKTAELESKLADQEKRYIALLTEKRQQIAKAEAEREILLAEQQVQLKNYNDKAESLTKVLNSVQTEQQKFVILRSEVDILRKEIGLARSKINEKFNEVVTRSEELFQQMGLAKRLEERNRQLVAQNTKQNDVLRRHKINIEAPVDGSTAVAKGMITGVKKSGEDIFVQLSIGSDDGLDKGYELETYRGNTYVGRIVVVLTQPDKSVAKVLKEFQRAQFMPRDEVETKSSLKLTAG